MIYLRVFLKSGRRLYHKVDAGHFAEANRDAKRSIKGFGHAENISRQDYEVGLLEMDIERADAAMKKDAREPDSTPLPGLRTPYLRNPGKPGGGWFNIALGGVSFLSGISMMIFWSTLDLDLRRSITILVLSGVLLAIGFAFFVAGLLANRNS